MLSMAWAMRALSLRSQCTVGAESEGDAGDARFDAAAEGVAVVLGGVDGGDHALGGGGVGAADGGGFEGGPVDGVEVGLRADLTDADDVAVEACARLLGEAAGDGAGGDAGGALAGAGAPPGSRARRCSRISGRRRGRRGRAGRG